MSLPASVSGVSDPYQPPGDHSAATPPIPRPREQVDAGRLWRCVLIPPGAGLACLAVALLGKLDSLLVVSLYAPPVLSLLMTPLFVLALRPRFGVGAIVGLTLTYLGGVLLLSFVLFYGACLVLLRVSGY